MYKTLLFLHNFWSNFQSNKIRQEPKRYLRFVTTKKLKFVLRRDYFLVSCVERLPQCRLYEWPEFQASDQTYSLVSLVVSGHLILELYLACTPLSRQRPVLCFCVKIVVYLKIWMLASRCRECWSMQQFPHDRNKTKRFLIVEFEVSKGKLIARRGLVWPPGWGLSYKQKVCMSSAWVLCSFLPQSKDMDYFPVGLSLCQSCDKLCPMSATHDPDKGKQLL